VAEHPTWLDWNSKETSLPASALTASNEEGSLETWLHNMTANLHDYSRCLIELIFLGIGLVLWETTDELDFWIQIATMIASE
jgi:hypothetical protein